MWADPAAKSLFDIDSKLLGNFPGSNTSVVRLRKKNRGRVELFSGKIAYQGLNGRVVISAQNDRGESWEFSVVKRLIKMAY